MTDLVHCSAIDNKPACPAVMVSRFGAARSSYEYEDEA